MIIQTIVEGPGDEIAVPKLLFKISRDRFPCGTLRVPAPYRLPRHQMTQEDRCRQHLRIAHASPEVDHVMFFIDGDDDCCKELNEKISPWAAEELRGMTFDIIGIEKEFECWLLASLTSLRGHRGIPPSAIGPRDPNSVRGAKETLSRLMPFGYSPTADQGVLAALVDVGETAQNSPSFARLLNKMAGAHDQHCKICRLKSIRHAI